MVALVNRLKQWVGFNYDAIEHRGKRRSVSRRVPREDKFTRGSKHRGLQSNAADLARNLSLAGWMVRRHLDYVAQFEFHARSGVEDLDNQIEALMLEDARPSRADIAGRFGREKLFRIAEARRVLDGDTLLVKHNDGRLQGIQADLIRDPDDRTGNTDQWVNGVLVGRVGRPIAYGIWSRKGYDSEKYLRRINAPNGIHYGFFERYAADQVRGVSPLVSALNPLRDIYENFDYALAKAKVAHIFALSIYRDRAEVPDDEEYEDSNGDEDGESAKQDGNAYDVDLSRPNILDLDDGDKAEVLESKQPSSQFQEFTKLVIQVALKSLDIPFSFYDESHTNFFGSRAAWLHYERSCKDRRDDQIEMRRNYTVWKLRLWIKEGRLTLPAGMRVSDVKFEWVPRGMPWWDPAKEIKGNVMAVAGAFDTPQRIVRAHGTGDLYDNIDEIAKAIEYAKEKGVPLSYVLPSENPESKKDADEVEATQAA